MLSRKHYKAIAEVLQEAAENNPSEDGRAAITEIRQKLGTYFKSDNSRFDRSRFERACLPHA